jgi:DNA-binding LytR/AlgR family response regulator
MKWNQIPFRELYPSERTQASKWRAIILFGLFVFLFLWIFQPFGLHHPIPNKFLILIGYGLITSFGVWLSMDILPLLFPAFFQEKKWFLWKELLYTMLVIVFIAIMNLIYSAFLGFFQLSLYNFLISIFMTAALGVFPVTANIFYTYYKQLNKHVNEAKDLSFPLRATQERHDQEVITIRDTEDRGILNLDIDHLIYLEAAQNYVEIYFLNDQGEIERKLVRNTLKNLEEQLHHIHSIIRTHRSFMVNLSHIRKVEGNAQGLQLQLSVSSKIIPVSRSRIRDFEDYFEKHS